MNYLNPICPYYDSKNVIKQEYRDRNLVLDNQKQIKVYLRRYMYVNYVIKNSLHPLIQ